MENNYRNGNYGYGHAKKELLELILKKYSSERKLYGEYMNNPDLIEKRLKEGAEKDRKTTMLKDLTDEERSVDTIFKKHKLGKWGVGLQKGLTQYVAETYDRERFEDDQYKEKYATVEEAMEYYLDALALAEANDHRMLLGEILARLGSSDPNQSSRMSHLQRALTVFREIGANDRMMEVQASVYRALLG